jgi:hypothetical protein
VNDGHQAVRGAQVNAYNYFFLLKTAGR